MSSFFDELKRRNVVRVGIAYILLAWVAAQVAELALDSFAAPDWVIKTVLLLLVLGLPFALFFSWAFELTPEGLKKEKDVDRSRSITHQTGRKLNTLIIAGLVVVIGMLLVDRSMAPAPVESPVEESTPVAASNSVAVLPFVDMSPDQDQEYFTDGLTENLLHALAQIQELKVAGRTSSFAFKNQNTDLRDIGQQLNVSSILEGSVQKAGGRIRITTQLINAADGYHIWSKTFDRDLTDIFSVQDEIAYSVADALRVSLLGEEVVTTGVNNHNFEAYNAYLLGLAEYRKNTIQSLNQAISEYQRAISLDPGMALAWSGLSQAESMRTGYTSDFEVGFERARAAAEKAIELDANLADGYSSLAMVQMSLDWDWDGAEKSLQRATELRPGDPDIVTEVARLRRIRGDMPGELAELERALERDPLNHKLTRFYAAALARSGRREEGLARALALAEATPDAGGVNYMLSMFYYTDGDCETALEYAAKEHFDFLQLESEATCHFELGDRKLAQNKLQELVDRYGDDVSWQVARVYAAWGDKDNAFAALDRGLAIRDPGLIFLRGSVIAGFLEDDPRFDQLLEQLGLN